MQKTITYLYPDASNAANLKMYQDRTNQIKAFYFTRDSYKQVYDLPYSLIYYFSPKIFYKIDILTSQ